MRLKKIIFPLGLLLMLGLGLAWVLTDLPAIDSLSEHLNTPSIRITDRDGHPLYEILPETGGRHAVIALATIPECLKQATIAVEDENFYSNPGVDLQGIARALWINLQGGETIAGGSTITQQVARSLLLPDEIAERSLRRKLRESILAWQMARQLSKDEILALYLNQTFYGGFAYGVEAAAQTYFGKPAADLLLPECALLAGLPQAPSYYNPFSNPEAALERQKIVLGLMEENGFISAAERQQAGQTPLSYNPAPFPIRAPHFVWMVKAELDRLELTPGASLIIRTSLSLNAQNIAENAIARQIAKLQGNNGLDHNVNNAAVVVLEVKTGEILALAGSANYFDTAIAGAVNMAAAPRQPGSAFKPFLYAEAFNPQTANPWTAATPLLDVETVFPASQGQVYIPKNYNGKENGPVPARVALASSLNIPAVLTLQKVGVNEMTQLANRIGINLLTDPEDYDLSLALGGGQMSLLELTSAYAVLANRGFANGRTTILDIRDADGRLLYQPTRPGQIQIFDPRVAWLISDILSDDNARQLGFGENSTLKIERPAAVKTGTTTNFHDNWTIGYTPSIVVGVWVGNSDYQAMRDVNGLTGAAPIWQEILRGLLRGQPKEAFIRPPGLEEQQVCTYSGLLPTRLCNKTHREWFLTETVPSQPDTLYRQIWLDVTTETLATNATAPANLSPLTVLNLPPQAQRWAHAQGLRLLSDFANPAEVEAVPLAFISPQPGAVYRISEKLAVSAQQIPLEIVAAAGVTNISLWLDGAQISSLAEPPYLHWWTLAEGTHHFQARGLLADGRALESAMLEITVSR